MAWAQQPLDVAPVLAMDTYVLAALNVIVKGANLGVDASPTGNDGTPAGGVVSLPVGAIFEGTDDTIDFGDIGNIQQVSMWVRPGTMTEQLFLVDAGAYVHLVAGTVTYVGLVAAATYVNGVAGTALVAGEWQHLVCQFTQVDANNFELAVDGAGNFGAIDVKDIRAMDAVWAAARVAWEYAQSVPDSALRLWDDGRAVDLSRFTRAPTLIGGVIAGHHEEFDGVDDRIDWGDLGNIQAVSLWIRPETATEEILLVDAGNDIMVNGGVMTYTGLTAVATYVNGVASTALAADVWQHLVCVFQQVDANNFEQGWDGVNFGDTHQRDLRVWDRVPSAGEAAMLYRQTRRSY